MKCKFILLYVSICLSSLATAWAQDRIIDVPWYETTNTYMFDIIKIEMTPENTVVSCQVNNNPGNWFRVIAHTVLKGESGKQYKLLKAEGIELNKKVFTPASGRLTFRLYFEPLDASETKIDYVEGPHEDDWLIQGISLHPEQAITTTNCVITGKLINRPACHRLVLMQYNHNDRSNAPIAIVSVRDGVFRYACNVDEVQRYTLIPMEELARSSYLLVNFFMEPGTVNIVIPDENSNDDIEIRGGTTNDLYQKYLLEREAKYHFNDLQKEYDILDSLDLYYTPRATELREYLSLYYRQKNQQKMDSIYALCQQLEHEGKVYTPQYQALQKKVERANKQAQTWKEDYIAQNPSLATLFMLMDDFIELSNYQINSLPHELERASYKNVDRLKDLFYTVFKPLFPAHPFTTNTENLIRSMQQIKIGGKYIDFTAPDLEGNPVTLSEQISGKVALIDLWASWCGPCRQSAKSMIPLYEKYKSKGFTIVGIARERNVNSARQAVASDGYPWLNLVELNDKGNIWYKYCLGNAAGGTFLVDRDGKIIAISPEATEVEAILEKILE